MSPIKSPDKLPLDGKFWQFARLVYQQNNVPSACLSLQNDLSADVTLLLFAGWVAINFQKCFSYEDVSDIQDFVTPWHQMIVKTLRQARIYLKSGPLPAPCIETEALRADIKEAELKAEQVEMAYLENIAGQWRQVEVADSNYPVRSNLEVVLRLTSDADSIGRLSHNIDILESAFLHVMSLLNCNQT